MIDNIRHLYLTEKIDILLLGIRAPSTNSKNQLNVILPLNRQLLLEISLIDQHFENRTPAIIFTRKFFF